MNDEVEASARQGRALVRSEREVEGTLLDLIVDEAPAERLGHYARSLRGYAAAEKENQL